MFEEDVINRLIQLRLEKDVSAREMSLSIGQNEGYIQNIESGKSLPSMSAFLSICDYFKIEPKDFFDIDNPNPEKVNEIIVYLKKLTPIQLDNLLSIIKDMVK